MKLDSSHNIHKLIGNHSSSMSVTDTDENSPIANHDNHRKLVQKIDSDEGADEQA